MLHRTGHSLGLEFHENPSISKGEQTILKEEMVLAIEPGIYDFSIGAFRIEDTAVVTTNGCEYLTNSPREITVL
jgi:Xaa-Pro aminopeptidase